MERKAHKIVLIDEFNSEIVMESDINELTSTLIWKDESKRKWNLKKENAILVGKYGEKLSMFQYGFKRVAKELNPEQMRIFMIMLGICDFENWVKVPQKEIAEELEMEVPHISRGLKGLFEKGFIQKIKHGSSNFYRINPEIAWKGSYSSWKGEIDTINFEKKKNEKIEKEKKDNEIQ